MHDLGATVSYSILCIGIMKVNGFWPRMITPKSQFNIYFVTVWEYLLGITKPKMSSNFEFNTFFY